MLLNLLYPLFILAFTIFLSSFLFKKYLVVAKSFNLYKGYSDRSSHSGKVFTGAGIIITLVLFTSLLVLDGISVFDFIPLTVLIITSFLISMLGFYDDFMTITAFHKYIILCFLIGMAINSGLDNDTTLITDLHGFLGIFEIPYTVGLIFTGFVYVAVINAVNLMDGIDSYLAGFCSLVFVLFGVLFYNSNLLTHAIICLILVGSLSVFLRYNISTRRKLFIGDSGSLFIGFWIAYFLIFFLQTDSINGNSNLFSLKLENYPVIAVAIINVPILDTLRVMIVRILKRKSPFSADRNHIHHIFIDHGFSHIRTAFMLCLINIINLTLIFSLEPIFSSYELTLVYVVINLIWFIMIYRLKKSLL